MASPWFNRGQQATRSSSVSSGRYANNASRASTSGTCSGNSTKFVQKYLDECRSFYSCIYCRTHFANHDELISRSFQGNRSRAYLFNTVINVLCGPSVQRELNTGAHSVADIYCANCGTTIGWKYEKAFVDSQKYKEGKYIIELAHVVRENRHLELDKRDVFLGLANAPAKRQQHQQSSAPTIGTSHRGSLSPASSGGQWSPGTSSSSSSPSSSSSSSPSSSSSNEAVGSQPSCRFSTSNQASIEGSGQSVPRRFVVVDLGGGGDDDNEDIDDDEVLMFPFYDDLYGNRPSFLNLPTSRGYQKRSRGSFYQDVAPYDWRRNRLSSSLSSTLPPTANTTDAPLQGSSQQQQQQQQQQQPIELSPNLFPGSSVFMDSPVNRTSQAQSDNSNNSGRLQLAANRCFFGSSSAASCSRPSIPPQSTSPPRVTCSSSSASGRCNETCNNSELAPNFGAPSSPSSSNDRAHFTPQADEYVDEHVDDYERDTQFQFDHDKHTPGVSEDGLLSSSSRKLTRTFAASTSVGQSQEGTLSKMMDSHAQWAPRSELLSSSESGGIARQPQAASCSETEPLGGSSSGQQAAPASVRGSSDSATSRTDTNGPSDETPALDDSDNNISASTTQPMAIRANSLSFDDDEFYDCNTDHEVANSSLSSK